MRKLGRRQKQMTLREARNIAARLVQMMHLFVGVQMRKAHHD